MCGQIYLSDMRASFIDISYSQFPQPVMTHREVCQQQYTGGGGGGAGTGGAGGAGAGAGGGAGEGGGAGGAGAGAGGAGAGEGGGGAGGAGGGGGGGGGAGGGGGGGGGGGPHRIQVTAAVRLHWVGWSKGCTVSEKVPTAAAAAAVAPLNSVATFIAAAAAMPGSDAVTGRKPRHRKGTAQHSSSTSLHRSSSSNSNSKAHWETTVLVKGSNSHLPQPQTHNLLPLGVV